MKVDRTSIVRWEGKNETYTTTEFDEKEDDMEVAAASAVAVVDGWIETSQYDPYKHFFAYIVVDVEHNGKTYRVNIEFENERPFPKAFHNGIREV